MDSPKRVRIRFSDKLLVKLREPCRKLQGFFSFQAVIASHSVRIWRRWDYMTKGPASCRAFQDAVSGWSANDGLVPGQIAGIHPRRPGQGDILQQGSGSALVTPHGGIEVHQEGGKQ